MSVNMNSMQYGAEFADEQQALIPRYGKPNIYYLLAVLSDNVDPECGRCRDFVKQILRNLILNDRKRRQVQPEILAFDDHYGCWLASNSPSTFPNSDFHFAAVSE